MPSDIFQGLKFTLGLHDLPEFFNSSSWSGKDAQQTINEQNAQECDATTVAQGVGAYFQKKL